MSVDAALVFTRTQGWHLQPSPDLLALVDPLEEPEPVPECPEPACGRERHTPGRPRNGWVHLRETGKPGLWCCSWACARITIDMLAS